MKFVRPYTVRTSRGFTLVELLVVIGIIAVLISLLLPMLSRVQMQAKDTACKANLRSIGQAVVMYVNDHRGFLPAYASQSTPVDLRPSSYQNVLPKWAGYNNWGLPGGPDWNNQPDKFIFHCPAMPRDKAVSGSMPGGYGINLDHLNWVSNSYPAPPVVKLSQVNAPWHKGLFIDAEGANFYSGNGAGGYFFRTADFRHYRSRGADLANPPNSTTPPPQPEPKSSLNCLMLDNHVEALSAKIFPYPPNEPMVEYYFNFHRRF